MTDEQYVCDVDACNNVRSRLIVDGWRVCVSCAAAWTGSERMKTRAARKVELVPVAAGQWRQDTTDDHYLYCVDRVQSDGLAACHMPGEDPEKHFWPVTNHRYSIDKDRLLTTPREVAEAYVSTLSEVDRARVGVFAKDGDCTDVLVRSGERDATFFLVGMDGVELCLRWLRDKLAKPQDQPVGTPPTNESEASHAPEIVKATGPLPVDSTLAGVPGEPGTMQAEVEALKARVRELEAHRDVMSRVHQINGEVNLAARAYIAACRDVVKAEASPELCSRSLQWRNEAFTDLHTAKAAAGRTLGELMQAVAKHEAGGG